MRELGLLKDKKHCYINMLYRGGGSGIRTRDTVSRIHTFQACAFNHSATPPDFALIATVGDRRKPGRALSARLAKGRTIVGRHPRARASGACAAYEPMLLRALRAS